MSEENSASRHCKSQHMKSSLDALNCGQTRKQNNSRETHSTSNPPTPSLCGQPCTDKGSPVGETEPSTDDQIQDFIAKRCEYFRTVLTQKKGKHGHAYSNKDWGFCNDDRNSTLQSDCNLPKSNSVARLAPTSASDKEYVKRQSVSCAEQCTAMAGQVLQEGYSKDSKANAELTPKSKETGDCTTIASEKHSTGTLVSVIESSKHAYRIESENSPSVYFDLPVKIHLDLIMTTKGNSRLVQITVKVKHLSVTMMKVSIVNGVIGTCGMA